MRLTRPTSRPVREGSSAAEFGHRVGRRSSAVAYSRSGPGRRARVAWYVRRLRSMSPQEVWWRSGDVLRQRAWRPRQVHPGATAPPDVARFTRGSGSRAEPGLAGAPRFESGLPAAALAAVPADDVQRLVRVADEILAGRWTVLGVTRQDLVDPDWFLDPLSGRRAPQAEYCFSVNHRDQAVTGNVKQVWELSRHHHLTVLACAYAVTGDRRYAERAASHLRSWWRENPFLSGIHWTSGIELGIRLISWVWTRRLLDGWDDVRSLFEQNELARKQIWWHQTYLSGFRSRGSSANNHVIAEAAGQLVAALAFPWFEESTAWADAAAILLQQELASNTFPSGVNRELAFDYHGLVAGAGPYRGRRSGPRRASPPGGDLAVPVPDAGCRRRLPGLRAAGPPSRRQRRRPRPRHRFPRGQPLGAAPRTWPGGLRRPRVVAAGPTRRGQHGPSGAGPAPPATGTAGQATVALRRRRDHHPPVRAGRRARDLVPLRQRPPRFPVYRGPRSRRRFVHRGPPCAGPIS